MLDKPFIGTEAVAAGVIRKHQLRSQYVALHPNVYVHPDIVLTLRARAIAAWLWSQRRGVIAGATASALHGAKWVDDTEPVELIVSCGRPPAGLRTSAMTLHGAERVHIGELPVTTIERTAFDLGRRGGLVTAVARLDALAAATGFEAVNVQQVARCHPHSRGLRQLESALGLMDAGAESPRETWLRLLLMRAGYPRPRTQIPVRSPDGRRRYYLDMGWEDINVAVEYEGDHHRTSKELFAYEIRRLEDLAAAQWQVVRVAARSDDADILDRVRRAWRLRGC
jgi:very-short-patch-repair endonuclease